MYKCYLCHKFGGDKSNVEKSREYLINLSTTCPDEYVFISPLITFEDLYNILDYDIGMKHCLSLLEVCDYMIVFDKDSNSKGCNIEKEFCHNHNIAIYEYDDFINMIKS